MKEPFTGITQMVPLSISQLFVAQGSIHKSKYDAMKRVAISSDGSINKEWVHDWDEPLVLQKVANTDRFIIINGHTRLSAIFDALYENNDQLTPGEWEQTQIELPIQFFGEEAEPTALANLVNLSGIGILQYA